MTAWLALYTGPERARAGELYDDLLGSHYSWDSNVPHSGTVAEGDVLVITTGSGKTMAGISVISEIISRRGTKTIQRCPQCRGTEVNPRKTKWPKYRCAKCKHECNEPLSQTQDVTLYRGTYAEGWVNLAGELSGRELRTFCVHPNSQNSFRELDYDKLTDALARRGIATPLRRVQKVQRIIAGGRRPTTTMTRIGQAGFREQLLDTFGAVCAFSGPQPAAVLDAAHLYRYAEEEKHHDGGGLLLRTDLHRLFDRGQLVVNADTLQIDVSDELTDYPLYKQLHGQALAVSNLPAKTRQWLAEHWDTYR